MTLRNKICILCILVYSKVIYSFETYKYNINSPIVNYQDCTITLSFSFYELLTISHNVLILHNPSFVLYTLCLYKGSFINNSLL